MRGTEVDKGAAWAVEGTGRGGFLQVILRYGRGVVVASSRSCFGGEVLACFPAFVQKVRWACRDCGR